MFAPIRTKRLLVRAVRPDDVEALHARRNHPEVARYEAWELPYTRESAQSAIDDALDAGTPLPERWWTATIADHDDREIYGDLVVHLTWAGRCAEVGYTLDRQHWGNGYATEALEALVEWLFTEHPVTRVFGMLHPDNPASARVLERVGMLFEGHTRLSFWVGDDNSDDHIYGMTRDDWETWRQRPRTGPATVELVELDGGNNHEAWRLRTHKTQEAFVSPMPQSFADALFPAGDEGETLVPWLRGVRADGDMVAFVMLAEPSPQNPEPYLWRLLVDRLHQRRGVGTRILDLVVDQCRAWRASTLLTSWSEGRGSPRPFYLRYGFEPTGRIVDDETEARLIL